jgi:hypothetical protein
MVVTSLAWRQPVYDCRAGAGPTVGAANDPIDPGKPVPPDHIVHNLLGLWRTVSSLHGVTVIAPAMPTWMVQTNA